MAKKLRLIVLGLLALSPTLKVNAVPVDFITAKKLVQNTYEEQIARKNVQSAEQALEYAKAQFEPSLALTYSKHLKQDYTSLKLGLSKEFKLFDIDLGYTYTPQGLNKNQLTLGMSFNFFKKSSLWFDLQLQRIAYEIEKAKYEKARAEAIYEIRNLYLAAAQAKALYELAKQEASLSQQLFDIIKERYRLGQKNYIDFLAAKSNLINSHQHKVQREVAFNNALYEFKIKVAAPKLTILDEFADTDYSRLKQIFELLPDTNQILQNYNMRILQLSQKQQQIKLKMAKDNIIPQLNLSAKYNYLSDADDYYAIEQNLRFNPLFRQPKWNISLNKTRLDLTRLILQQQRRNLIAIYSTSMALLHSEMKLLDLLTEQISIKKEELNLRLEAYKAGQISLTDYMSVQDSYISLMQQRINELSKIYDLFNKIILLGGEK